ncbi:protein lethal(2)essential for life-like [Trichogramma pretiosum]|uniref:protein lethal(2)essential for life-like n=1 Tax=Trichogramma pretiosum TaxID=7493 RepID=UPI0006C99C10|nr:protein lethal(2)essential for life-like [Trichogramma pretiosum]
MVSTLLPLLLSTAYFGGDLDGPKLSPNRLLDQNFGLSLSPEQLLLSRYYYALPSSSILRDRTGVGSLLDNYYRPWNELLRQQAGDQRRGISRVKYDENEFRVHLDVQQFKPEEIEVSVDEERRHLVIKAKHEEKKDEHGLISRQFVRRYALPERAELDRVASEISSDGVLTIQAPLKPLDKEKEKKEQVRRIKIEYTGKPALTEQQTEEQKKQTEEDDEISITTEEPEFGSGSSSTTTASSATTEKQQ